MSLDDSALENMTSLLPREARLRLFQDLCKVLGEPIPEKVWLATGIRKTDVYRYLPKSRSSRGGLVPNPKTSVRVIKALLRRRKIQLVLEALDPVENKIRRACREYFDWKKELRKRNIIYNPLSREEMDRIKKSQY